MAEVFWAISRELLGSNAWEASKRPCEGEEHVSQKALYAYLLAQARGVDPIAAVCLSLFRAHLLRRSGKEFEHLISSLSRDLIQALEAFNFANPRSTQTWTQNPNPWVNSFSMDHKALGQLRENALCRVILDAEIANHLHNLARDERYLPTPESLTQQIEGLITASDLSREAESQIFATAMTPYTRVIFCSSIGEEAVCQFGACQHLSSFTISCSHCATCEVLCEKHAKETKQNVNWGDWVTFTKTCNHKVEIREAGWLPLRWIEVGSNV